jgi:hypothetical protein
MTRSASTPRRAKTYRQYRTQDYIQQEWTMLGRIGLDDEELGVVWGIEGGPHPTSRSVIMSHVEVRDHALWMKHIDGTNH